MNIAKLIMEFANREKVPVEVDDIVEHLKSLGITDEIYFFDVEIDTNILKGEIKHWEYPASEEGPVRRVADINTAKSLTLAEKRLVQSKEVLHVLDPEHWRVNTFDSVEDLIEKIVVPAELQDHANDGDQVLSDRVMMWHALALLFPMATRNLLMAPYKDGKISLAFIADLVELPEFYVSLVMSDHWNRVHHKMIRPQRIAGPDRVSTLKADHSTIEVHSVPMGTDPYSYAKHLQERSRTLTTPVGVFLIESGGEKKMISAGELTSYKPRGTA